MISNILFCIPYAGGLAGYYRKFIKYLDSSIDLFPVELAGRGTRISEDFYASFDDAVEDIYSRITREIGSKPYYLFGHSMGGQIVYELCVELKKNGQRMPEHVFISAIYPPYINEASALNNYSDSELRKELEKWGGTSSEFFTDNSLLEYFLPILKADLRMLERKVLKDDVINCNFTVLWGNEDKESRLMQGWNKMTSEKCNLVEFEGGHFYINNNLEGVMKVICDVIKKG